MKTRAAAREKLGVPGPCAETPPPGPGEVLVRIAAAGLCHYDPSVINGGRPRPMVLGHKAAAIVMGTGRNVADLGPGNHVVMVFVPSCGHCLPCAEGRPALCLAGAQANGAGTLLQGTRRLSCDGAAPNHHFGCSACAEYAVP